ncbi:MAG: hypothetical protein GWN82_20470, partial [Gemmatimonadetes bacterium]|nr:hypothetical protein [Gemmatimonadota bacterium]NIU32991.1 hypothetical protein [Gemmatimonadota bacterium]NIV63350.1 hypothetical protein [Gemmatimonadota bacterium]NIW66068.1 hypothetical protein [Gemmatimonadota bacterium]NIX41362.1 hypothetical protein [Gemmatimonadota bacterium]
GGELDKASLDGRIDDEEALARRLAEVLGLEAVESLEELSAAIFDAPRGAILDAVVLDNLEHLYMRVPGGTDIVERLLTLMAETDPRVFWIGGITASAWQLISMA